MCIIILDLEGGQLEEKYLRNLYDRNHDGFGIISLKEGTPHEPEKIANPTSVDEVLELWNRYNDGPYIAHMRLRTHGIIDEDNCHPYELGGDNYFFHNGMMNFVKQIDDKKSDTWHFAEYFLKPMGDALFEKLEIPEFCATLEKMIGTNKFAFYHHSKQVYVVNEKAGTWFVKDKLWVSNELSLRVSIKDKPTNVYKPPYSTVGAGFHNTGVTTSSRPVNTALVTPAKETFTDRDLLNMSILEIAACLRFMPITFNAAVNRHFPDAPNIISDEMDTKQQALQYFIAFGDLDVVNSSSKAAVG